MTLHYIDLFNVNRNSFNFFIIIIIISDIGKAMPVQFVGKYNTFSHDIANQRNKYYCKLYFIIIKFQNKYVSKKIYILCYVPNSIKQKADKQEKFGDFV